MRCGFRPHDHDRTTESREVSLLDFGPLWRGVGLQRERGPTVNVVNRWGIKQPPNGTKFDGWSTCAIPRPLGKSRSIPRTFLSRSRNKVREGQRARANVVGLRTDNGENRGNPNGCKF